jgi:hypothetical protein
MPFAAIRRRTGRTPAETVLSAQAAATITLRTDFPSVGMPMPNRPVSRSLGSHRSTGRRKRTGGHADERALPQPVLLASAHRSDDRLRRLRVDAGQTHDEVANGNLNSGRICARRNIGASDDQG